MSSVYMTNKVLYGKWYVKIVNLTYQLQKMIV